MKKRVLFLALIGAMSIASLTSCGEQNIPDTVITDDNKNDNNYKIEDNELSQMVYNEFLKSYPNLTYDDFISNGIIWYADRISSIYFVYADSYIRLKNNEFDLKIILIDGKETDSEYINNEWIKTKEYIYINGEPKIIYQLYLNSDGTFRSKYEYTYDDNGNLLTDTYSEYINNELIEIREYIHINGLSQISYYISFNSKTKVEYTYDDNGNLLTDTYSKYINNEWIKISEYIYINDVKKSIYQIASYSDGTFYSKTEITYDDNGNLLTSTYSEYIKNEWIKISECIYINGESREIYSIDLKSDGTFYSKREITYDEYGNPLTTVYSKYENDTWVLESKSKSEYTYDDNGNLLTYTLLKYINNEWIKIGEYIYINGEPKIIYQVYLNSDGTFYSKTEITYDDNGKLLNETDYCYENGIFKTKDEYTYDANGNILTLICSYYINNEWIKIREYIYINGEQKNIYQVYLNSDGTFRSKYEYTYDDNGNLLTDTYSEYENDTWVYRTKHEYTYDDNGNQLTETYDYVDGEWVLQS